MRKPGFSDATKRIINARSGFICELDSCGRAVHYHHRAPRSMGGTSVAWVNQPGNAFHISLACHSRIESDRALARRNGWLVSRNGYMKATEIPVLRRGEVVLLDDDGNIQPYIDGLAVAG